MRKREIHIKKLKTTTPLGHRDGLQSLTKQTEGQTQGNKLRLPATLQGLLTLLWVLTLPPWHTVCHPLVVDIAETVAGDAWFLEVIILIYVEVEHGIQVHKLLVTCVGQRGIYLGLLQPLPQAPWPHCVEDDALVVDKGRFRKCFLEEGDLGISRDACESLSIGRFWGKRVQGLLGWPDWQQGLGTSQGACEKKRALKFRLEESEDSCGDRFLLVNGKRRELEFFRMNFKVTRLTRISPIYITDI